MMRILRTRGLPSGLEGMDAVAVRPDAAGSLEEIELAYHLAKEAFGSKNNIAKKLKFEFLLWLSGTRDIENALSKTAPEEGGDAIVVIFSDEHIEGEAPGLKERGDPLALERISLSRITG